MIFPLAFVAKSHALNMFMTEAVKSYFDTLFSKKVIVLWIISSTAMTLAGPFGTYNGLTMAERAIYWPGIIALSFIIGFTIRPLVHYLSPGIASWPADFAISVLFMAFFTPPLFWITASVASVPQEQFMHPAMMAGINFSIPMAAAILHHFLQPEVSGEDRRTNINVPRLLRRLEEQASSIHRIGVRDHYVDVYTDVGRTSLLMRFSDAVDEVGDTMGLRVHRSHWVAYDAVEAIVQDGARMFLRLTCGTQIPVSRNYRELVEQEVADRLA